MTDFVLDPLPLRLGRAPHFEVLNAIIQPVTVAVMNVLVSSQRPTEVPGHHEAVLGDG